MDILLHMAIKGPKNYLCRITFQQEFPTTGAEQKSPFESALAGHRYQQLERTREGTCTRMSAKIKDRWPIPSTHKKALRRQDKLVNHCKPVSLIEIMWQKGSVCVGGGGGGTAMLSGTYCVSVYLYSLCRV